MQTPDKRRLHLYHRLRKSSASFRELSDYLIQKEETDDCSYPFSENTWLRDQRAMRDLFHVSVRYHPQTGKYYLEQNTDPDKLSPQEVQGQRIAEAYNTLYLLDAAEGLKGVVFPESRRPQGTEHFAPLLEAIRKRRLVSFRHFHYYHGSFTDRTVAPLALRESQGRWYLIGLEEEQLKTYGLDRISLLEQTKVKFAKPKDVDPDACFRDYFGVLRPEGSEPADIELLFSVKQGRYIQSFPLHHSQKLLSENEDGMRFSLRLCITYDFEMALLSFNTEMKVLAPAHLRQRIRTLAQTMADEYA